MLARLTLPASVTTVGGYANAFCCCGSLRSLTISESVSIIGEGVFSERSSLSSLRMGDAVTSIGDFAFYG